ncbi:MAG: hypothetical protein Q8936_04100 [Bacillota bacterium]|nr:hypothetical protein [Bacillota bacterium]
MKAIKLTFSLLLSLLITINLVLLQCSYFTNKVFYNYNFYIDKFEKYQLYSYIQDVAKKNLGSLAKTYNLPENIFSSIITLDYIKLQVQGATKGFLNYMLYKTNNLPYININNGVNNANSNVSNSASYTTDLTTIINSQNFQSARAALYRLYLYKNTLICTLIILSFALLIIKRKDIFSFLIWLACSFMTGGFIAILLSFIGISSSIVKNINTGIPNLNLMITAILKDYFRYFLYCGGILAGMGILVLAASLIIKNILFSKKTITS